MDVLQHFKKENPFGTIASQQKKKWEPLKESGILLKQKDPVHTALQANAITKII